MFLALGIFTIDGDKIKNIIIILQMQMIPTASRLSNSQQRRRKALVSRSLATETAAHSSPQATGWWQATPLTTFLPFASATKAPKCMGCYSSTDLYGMEGCVVQADCLSHGCFTHKVVTQPTTSLVQDRESLLAEISLLTNILDC